MNGRGASLGPSLSWLSILVPTYTFAWDEVDRVEAVALGIRFCLRHRVRGLRRRGPWALMWGRPRWLTFWCRGRDWDAIWASIPTHLWAP